MVLNSQAYYKLIGVKDVKSERNSNNPRPIFTSRI